jgi:hypothetical protein
MEHDDGLVRRCAGARRGVRLDSPATVLHEVPMRLVELAVVLTLSLSGGIGFGTRSMDLQRKR